MNTYGDSGKENVLLPENLSTTMIIFEQPSAATVFGLEDGIKGDVKGVMQRQSGVVLLSYLSWKDNCWV